ncbi:MAG TPA: RNA polymerase sigma factor [Vicinamibacterales bacterium]|nr:RNA polymerase sigma factor [Vicinamibacterales bacterium]
MASPLTLTFNGGSGADWDVTVVRQHAVAIPDAGLEELGEADLVAACLDGRPGAFDLIVERHRRPVYQICYRFMGNHEDASDLSQDVFLRAYRGLRQFKGHSALGTWLHRIAVNACLNRVAVKMPKIEPIEETQHVDTTSESASERLLRDERAARVRAAVARLPRKQRAALVLRTFQEKSHQEIAEALGTSVGAAKANVFHALRNLKKLLGDL